MKLFICCVLLSLTLGAQARWRSGLHRSPHYHGLTSQMMSPPQVSAVTATGFTVSWTTTKPLTTELLYGAGSLNQVHNNTTLTGQHSVTLTGLQAATTYEFEAVSTDSANLNLRSRVGTVTTAAAPPAPAPAPTLSTPQVSNITASGFTVSWTTSVALNTKLLYGSTSLTQVQNSATLSTQHSVTVSGLQPATKYEYEAQSSDGAQINLSSAVQTVTTAAAPAPAPTISTPQVSNITASGFTVTWTTSVALNSKLLYGTTSLSQTQNTTSLVTQHSVTLTGLQAATKYEYEAQSSDGAQVNLSSAVQTTTTAAAAPTPPPTTGSRLFPGAGADWLYSPPTGTPLNISSIASSMGFHLNTHDGGFDFPVQYTDGTHGCTTFTDTLIYSYNKDNICVPNPANGYHPSVGGWGANDGHVVIVDTATGNYYDFWKLSVDSNFQPTSTNVGKIVEGSLSGNGTPGTTAAQVTGLAGDILPGELDCVTCLNHALNIIVPGSSNSPKVCTQFPAKATDGSVSGAVFCEGGKIRFDPSIDVNTLAASTAVKAIARALQLYGGAITDQTGSTKISIYTDLPSQPDTTGLNLIAQHLWIYY